MKKVSLVLILNLLVNAALYSAVWNLLLTHLGFSIADLSIFISVSYLVQTFCEIPSGLIADLLGARATLTIGQIIHLLVLATFCFAPSLATLVLFACGTGIAYALYSDTDTTLVYQQLRRHHQTPLYPRFIAFYNTLGFVGSGIAGLIGSYLATTYSLTITLWATLPIFALRLGLIFLLPAPRQLPHSTYVPTFSHNVLRGCWEEIKTNTLLRETMFFGAMIYTFNMLVWYYYQSYADAIHIPLAYFGLLAILFSVCEAAPQYLARLFLTHPAIRQVYIVVIYLSCICFFAAGYSLDNFGFLYLLFTVLLTGFTLPLTDTLIRRATTTRTWTTMISLKAFAVIFAFALGNLIFGAIADSVSLAAAFRQLAIIILILTLIFAFINPWFTRKKQEKRHTELSI